MCPLIRPYVVAHSGRLPHGPLRQALRQRRKKTSGSRCGVLDVWDETYSSLRTSQFISVELTKPQCMTGYDGARTQRAV